MKKFLLSALLPLLLFFNIPFSHAPAVTARAASSAPQSGAYACILSESAFFYAAPDERRGLFLLPETYYVKLVEYGEDYSKIEYSTDGTNSLRLLGYAKTSALTFVDYTPSNPYLYYTFDLTYRLDSAVAADSAFLTEYTVTCGYYGDYRIGSETYCYVLRDGQLGYVPKPADLEYSENTEYADRLNGQEEGTPVSAPAAEEKSKTSPVQIAILVALCLLVPVLAALILKPPKRPPYDSEE